MSINSNKSLIHNFWRQIFFMKSDRQKSKQVPKPKIFYKLVFEYRTFSSAGIMTLRSLRYHHTGYVVY